MRPHKLILKAFGPFANETAVDFDSMGNNIYLICGDTGSGKTTIFDGIIYALYGTASGGARSTLGTEAFHSDYAKEGSHRDEMRVEFTFSNAGRTFTVFRRMYWGKKGDSKVMSRESVLTENGNTIVFGKGREDRDDVTLKVTEILGLDADQFRRIIMLAQGEFQRFLTAKSDERGVILGKLYDNRAHQDFQLRLKAAAAQLKEMDRGALEEVKARLAMFVFPETEAEAESMNIDMSDKEAEAVDSFSPDNPLLLPKMQEIIDSMSARLEPAGISFREKESALKKLEAALVSGKTCNALFDDLDKKKSQLKELEGEAKQIDELRELAGLALAAQKVLPFESALTKSAGELTLTLQRIEELKERQAKLEEKAGQLKDFSEAVRKDNTVKKEALSGKAASLKNVLHFYDDLTESIVNRKSKEAARDRALALEKDAAVKLQKLEAQQKELEKRLLSLDLAGEASVSGTKQRLDELTRHRTVLMEISDLSGEIRQLSKEKALLDEAFSKAGDAELAAEKEHLRLNTAFIQGQAGILAQDLREKISQQGEAPCPVCGAVHTSGDIDRFAKWHEDIPTREAVDKALAVWEKARKKLKEAEDKRSSKASELLGMQQKMEVLSGQAKDFMAQDQKVSDAIAGCDELISKARDAYNKAVRDKEEKESASAKKLQIDEQVLTAREALLSASQKRSEAESAAASAKTSEDNWRVQLKGLPENKDEALKDISALEEKARALQKQVDDAAAALELCLRDQASCSGKLAGAYTEKETREKTRKAAEEEFFLQLEKQSFADVSGYRAARSPEGRLLNAEELAAWITARNEKIEAFTRKRSDLLAAIAQLSKSTEGMARTDLNALRLRIEKASEDVKKAGDLLKELETTVKTDRSIYSEVSGIQKRRENFGKVYAKLGPMAETADGRYSFSRYVLTGFFHNIVEHANIHLETMTDGEYCLVPKETGDGRSNIGLELKVLNTITGLERETASLSGGQLFEASLSLALGLSDVVQMESASSIRIDSMFIDEGFGSLDGGRLDKSIEVLSHLSAGKRQIGIISHVARLDECLPRKIHVIAGEHGSTVRIETDA